MFFYLPLILPQNVPLIFSVHLWIPLYKPYFFENLLNYLRYRFFNFVDELVSILFGLHVFIPL